MLVFPNCKINIGLYIASKRADGFHNIETIFYPIPPKDALEIIPETSSNTAVSFTISGNIIPGNSNDNLCIKAYRLLQKDFPQLPTVKIHLHKEIPTGAGLGGGSADGAFALKLLNDKFKLGLSQEKLINYALQLGSDCPFFIINTPCFASGRGEILESISLSLSGYTMLLINPGIHINTGQSFAALNIQNSMSHKEALLNAVFSPVSLWKNTISNDFEKGVFEKYPQIGAIKDALYKAGAEYAAMSGTGSTVYGLFPENTPIELNFPENYYVKTLQL